MQTGFPASGPCISGHRDLIAWLEKGSQRMSDPTRELGITPTDFGTLPTLDESIPKEPHDPERINPKISADIHYWANQFGVSGQVLHEAIRVHGNSVAKVRAALEHHQVNMSRTNG
jgi:hypothetical protein